MATPKLSRSDVEKFIAAYRVAVSAGHVTRGGRVHTGHQSAVAVAVMELGLRPNAKRARLAGADEMQPGWDQIPGRSDTFTPPVIPPAHEPVAEMVDRRIAAYERRREASRAREWMKFRIEETAPFMLVFVGDPHVDDDGSDLGLLQRHLDLIEATPGSWAVGMGDWTNNWIGRLGRLYGEQGTTQSDAWRFAEWMLKRPIWLLLLRGNHDMWSGAGDPLRWIAREGLAPLADWQAQFTVECGSASWRIHAAHDFPGHSMWNKLHAPLRRAKMTGHGADLFIAGHRHTFALAEEQDEHTGRVAWLARAKGYKSIDSYALNLGYGQAQDRGQSIAAVCDPRTGRMQCYSDLEEAAAFMSWLRRPRIRVPAA